MSEAENLHLTSRDKPQTKCRHNQMYGIVFSYGIYEVYMKCKSISCFELVLIMPMKIF